MAAGVVIEPNSANVRARIDELKANYAQWRRLLDSAIEIKNSGGGNNWTAVAAALGEVNATNGQAVFENMDAIMGAMTTANNAASPMDGAAL